MRSFDPTIRRREFLATAAAGLTLPAWAGAAGSPVFTAPELCTDQAIEVDGEAADMWALGITFWMLLFGEAPFRAVGLIGICPPLLK